MSDLISRQDAIEAVIAEGRKVYTSECANAERIVYEADAVEVLAMLPSADRPTGEWVEKDGETVCSLCGNSVSFSWTEDGWVLGKFCQTCGARMRW